MYFSGIRKSYAWKEIDFYSTKLYITKTCSYIHMQNCVITKPKTNESNRIIYLNDKFLKVLEEYN